MSVSIVLDRFRRARSAGWPALLIGSLLLIGVASHRVVADDDEHGPSFDRTGDIGASTDPSPELMPLEVLQLPPSADAAVLVDVERNQLYVYRTDGEQLVLRDRIYVAIGKAGAGKGREGDERTPLGVYFVSAHLPGRKLPSIYGNGALTISYPNAWDRRQGRTGSGTWLHGTDKDDRTLLPRSSRGCLTLLNEDFDAVLAGSRLPAHAGGGQPQPAMDRPRAVARGSAGVDDRGRGLPHCLGGARYREISVALPSRLSLDRGSGPACLAGPQTTGQRGVSASSTCSSPTSVSTPTQRSPTCTW